MGFAAPAPESARLGGDEMRGRDREWSQVEGLFRTLEQGGTGTLLVDGEPGVGKSRLLNEAADAAPHHGIGVIRGSVEELGELVSCGFLLEALDLPFEAESIGSPAHLLDRLTKGFLERAGAPVLAVFDDLHRAEPATLRTVRLLHDRLTTQPVGWLLSGSTAGNDARAACLFGLLERNGAARVTLAPLSPEAVAELAADMLGRPPDPTTRALVAGAGGNPLLITELLAGLRVEGRLDASCGAMSRAHLPARLRTVVRRWTDALGGEARSLVETVAVLGGPLPIEQAASLLGTTPAGLLSAIEEATAAGILDVTGRGLAFRYELIGTATATWVPPPIRDALLSQSGALTDLEPAGTPFTASAAAVHAAVADGRLEEAENMVQERLAGNRSAQNVAELRCLLSDIMYRTGRGDEAIHEADSVLALPARWHHVRDRAVVVRLYAMTRLQDEYVRAYADEIIDGESGHGPTVMVAALTALATIERDEGRLSNAVALAEDAWRLASEDRPDERRYEACLTIAAMLIDVRRLDEARAMLQQARTDMLAHDHLAWAADVAALEARAEFAAGRFDGAITEGRRALSLAAVHNIPLAAEVASGMLAAVALRRGDLREATRRVAAPAEGSSEARARHALLAAQVTEARDGPRSAMTLLTSLCGPLRQPSSLLAMDPTVSAWMVRVAMGAGDRATAESIVTMAESLSQASLGFPMLAASAAHARGLLDGDREALTLAAEQIEDIWARASAEEDLGVLLKAVGEQQEAITSLDRALAIYHDIGSTRDAARIRRKLRGMGVRRRHWRNTPRPASGWDSLTETEDAVALLAVDGHTNRQIAEQMFLSVHTVAFHLRHVYRKLNIGSRVELTRLAVAQERVDPDRSHDESDN
ncbi:AAA family ATPase [Nonomuraea sp. C10]|uniref:AAA family ATPase n=1 Tax=Nonomuraea sp. C10 TaxID=2600577 RepID=UPI0011CDB5B8|nr:AAA family ATPase [Nonomuraea sp. C10]TXK41514.1 AAA family ATPase [Nonomuraea sp. C10]